MPTTMTGARALLTTTTAALLLALSACGGSSDEGGAAGGTTSEAVLQEARKATAAATAPQQTPSFGDTPKAPAGKKQIYIIPCSFALSCYDQAKMAAEAVEALGWSYKFVDGKAQPGPTNAGIVQAVNNDADGVILVSVPVETIKPSLAKTREAGIPVVSITGSNPVGPEGVSAETSTPDSAASQGRLMADFAIAESDGTAKIIFVDDTAQNALKYTKNGFMEEIEKCGGCEIVDTVTFTTADVQTRLAQLVQTSIQRNPDAQFVISPYSAATTFTQKAIAQTGRDVQIIAQASAADNYAAMRKRETVAGSVEISLMWHSWVAVNDMVRLLSGEDHIEGSTSMNRLITQENVSEVPEGEVWNFDTDFRSEFKQAWGVG